MPIKKPFYELQYDTLPGELLEAFCRVDEAVSRLDERARLSPLGEPWAHRLLYRNACAAIHNQHGLIFLEALVLLDGHAYTGVMSPDLSSGLATLKFWQTGLRENASALLRSPMPGELPRPLASELFRDPLAVGDVPDFFWDPDWDEAGRLLQWRSIWQATNHLPALLASAIVWDAWHALQPEQQGPWRSTLLASLVLRARAKTRHMLLPIDTGQHLVRNGWKASDGFTTRIKTYFEIVAAAVKSAGTEFNSLESAKERMTLKLRAIRKNSRLGELVQLMLAKPLVSIPLACNELGISKQALRKLIDQLGSTPREITDRKRYRCWTVT